MAGKIEEAAEKMWHLAQSRVAATLAKSNEAEITHLWKESPKGFYAVSNLGRDALRSHLMEDT